MFLLICKLYICIQNVFGHIFYRSRLHLYWQFWQFEVQKLAYMLILAAGGSSPYLSSVGGYPPFPPRKKTFFFSHWFSIKGGGAHWTSRGSYHLQPKWACRRVFVLQIAKPAGTSEVECYKRCDQIRFEYKCTVYKLVKTLHWIHLHCIIIDK